MLNKKLMSIMLLAAILVLSGCGTKDENLNDGTTEEAGAEETAATSETEDTSGTETTDEDVAEVEIKLDYATGLDENGFFKDVSALEYVELFDYENVTIPAEVHTVSDDAVQSQIDSLLTSFSTTSQVTDRAIVDGDTVNIDYVGSVDGVEFEGGSTGGTGADVTIGVTNYIDDFLEQLIGHTPGEAFDINVTFPEEYGKEELNGKDAVFAITVNYISEQVEPELTDDFVAENLAATYQWTTIDEMKEGISSQLQKAAISSYIQTDLIGSTAVSSVPDTVLEYQKSSMENYYKSAAISYGMTLDDFLANYLGMESMDAIYEEAADQLTEMANYTLTIQAIAESAKLNATDDILSEYFTEFNGSGDYSEFEETYGIEYLRYTILQEMVMDYLIDNAKLL